MKTENFVLKNKLFFYMFYFGEFNERLLIILVKLRTKAQIIFYAGRKCLIYLRIFGTENLLHKKCHISGISIFKRP